MRSFTDGDRCLLLQEQLTKERIDAVLLFLREERPKELDLHKADPALVQALLRTEGICSGLKVLKPLMLVCTLLVAVLIHASETRFTWV
jgi:hypothetical protein